MKNIFLCLLLIFFCLQAVAQKDTSTQIINQKLEANSAYVDSMIAETERMNKAMDSNMKAYDQEMMKAATQRDSTTRVANLEAFMNDRKE